MGDLISRSALIEALEKEEKECEDCMIMPNWYSALRILGEQQTADAVPVVHGKWDKYRLSKLFKLTCSVCHAEVDEKTPFCPGCGAKMDGKKVQE